LKVVFFDPFRQWDEVADALRAYPGIDFVHPADNPALAEALAGAQVLVTGNRSYVADTAATIRDNGKSLRWIQFTTSGTDNAFKHGMPSGVVVTNMAGLRAFAVAEQAFALMLALVRKLRATEAARGREAWVRDDLIPVADNLAGKHLLIIGLGAIGQEIARKAKAFDMQVTAVTRSAKPLPHVDRIRPREELVEACAEADIVLMAALYEDGADRLLSRAAIRAMKPGAYVINIARGALIDEDALIEALETNRIAGAGLDVTAVEPLPVGHKLWSMANVLLTPHIAGAGSDGTGESIASVVTGNLRRWIAGEQLVKIVADKTP
jgi:phosphoglycerate dehydrogenase-like enzyme